MKDVFKEVKFGWLLLTLSGILILVGIPKFWTGDFTYWAVAHLIYATGVILFWADT